LNRRQKAGLTRQSTEFDPDTPDRGCAVTEWAGDRDGKVERPMRLRPRGTMRLAPADDILPGRKSAIYQSPWFNERHATLRVNNTTCRGSSGR